MMVSKDVLCSPCLFYFVLYSWSKMLPTRRVLLETGGEFQVLPRDESCLEHGSSKNDHQTFQEEEY